MPIISEQDLRRQLAGGELAPVYLLTGEEKLPLSQAARSLIDRAGGEGVAEFNRSELPGDAAMEKIIDAAVALPFMAGRKCVAVSDFDPMERPGDTEKLLELIDGLPETTVLVLYYPTVVMEKYTRDRFGREDPKAKAASWKKLLERAARTGCVVQFAQREAPELRRGLIDRAGRQGCALSPQAADRLIQYAGRDMHRLQSELEKLCAYTLGMGGKEITLQTVEALTPKSTETTVFALTDALIDGKPGRAYELLDTLLYQKEKPRDLLNRIAQQYIDMFRVKMALESGKTAFDIKEYAQYSDYPIKKAQKRLPYFPLPVLKECLGLLMRADLALKGSRLDDRLVLERLIAQLLLAAQEGAA